ncbi:MAG: outer membrane protein transport protein [Proteobacteria bacterium]|nr:outer membrane protein transport protein [Pseudomonadota bacterium]MBU1640768.1 outer membrane protein transport protein [Pseudomonadota bacterium]
MKKIALLVLAGVFTAGSALASGWRIPEQSVNSTALSAAYIANAHGADAAYFNPANMSFEEDKENWQLEVDAQYIHLTSVEFTHLTTPALDGNSKEEDFVLPLFHLVSPEFSNMRFGLSFTVPGGLSKRWADPYPGATAGEFSLKVLELNPTLSYKLHDKVSVAAGVRAVHSEGRVSSDAAISRELEGDSCDEGYNLALTVKPMANLTTSVTWRSKVNLTLEGDATLKYAPTTIFDYDDDGEVSVPLPEILSLAVAYTLKNTTIEVVWDRTFWSDYDELDFDYAQTFAAGHPFYLFDNSVAKDYNDSDAFRIGVTQKLLENRLTLMAGFAIDETPVPDHSLGFELPDSDAKIYSLGCKYKLNDQYELGLAYLYDDKDERILRVDDNNSIVGEFKNAAAHMVTVGLNTTF